MQTKVSVTRQSHILSEATSLLEFSLHYSNKFQANKVMSLCRNVFRSPLKKKQFPPLTYWIGSVT